MAGLAQIQDREAAVTEGESVVVLECDALPVGPAVRERADETLGGRALDPAPVQLPYARDSADGKALPLR